MSQIYANLLLLLKHYLDLINCLALSEEAYIFITGIYLKYVTSSYNSGCFAACQADECILFNNINGVWRRGFIQAT